MRSEKTATRPGRPVKGPNIIHNSVNIWYSVVPLMLNTDLNSSNTQQLKWLRSLSLASTLLETSSLVNQSFS